MSTELKTQIDPFALALPVTVVKHPNAGKVILEDDNGEWLCESKAKADESRKLVLVLIERAQRLLYDAAETACPLNGWADQWEQISEHADATKALWHSINNAPRPTGHD